MSSPQKTISKEGLADYIGRSSVFGPLSSPAPESRDVSSRDASTDSSDNANAGTPDKSSKSGKPNKNGKPKKKVNPGKKSKLKPMTYKLPEDLIMSIRQVAYWQRKDVQDVVAEILRRGLEGVPEANLAKIPNL